MKARRILILFGLILLTLCLITGCKEEPEHTHEWGEGTVTTAATCTTAGERTFTCSCGETKTETIEALGHVEVDDPLVAPTCTEPGKTAGKHCSRCEAVLVAQSDLDPLGHDWDDGVVTTSATCTAKGEKTYTCQACETKRTEEIAVNAANHTGGTEVRDGVAATCYAVGYSGDVYCKGCGAKIESGTATAKVAHNWDDGVETTPATCTEDGEKTYTCQNEGCTETKTETIFALWHDIEYIAPKAASCTKKGNNAYYHCKRCDKCFADEDGEYPRDKASFEISMLDHDWDYENGVQTKDPTCTEAGEMTYTCKNENCTAQTTDTTAEAVKALGHALEEVKAVSATCTENGTFGHYRCTREGCGMLFKDVNGEEPTNDEEIVDPAKGHDFTGEPEITPATCVAEGKKVYTCLNGCGTTDTKKIDKISHKLQWVDDQESTCTTAGVAGHYECSSCHGTFSDKNGTQEVSYDDLVTSLPKGHTIVAEADEIPASETVPGIRAYQFCSVCEQYIYTDNEENPSASKNFVDLILQPTGEGQAHEGYELHDAQYSDCKTETAGNIAYVTCTCHSDKRYYLDGAEVKVGTQEDVTIPYSHTLEFVPESPADASEGKHATGAHYKCSVCGKLFADENGLEVIENLEDIEVHSWTWYADDQIPGYKAHYACDVCVVWAQQDYTIIEDPNSWITESSGCKHEHYETYDVDGAVVYECYDCGKYYDEDWNELDI